MQLYENIRKRREELGMSQDELAKKMGYKSRASINKIEMGKADIPQSKIAEFARVLNVSPGELMGWDKKKSLVAGGLGVAAGAAMLGGPIGVAAAAPALVVDATLGGYINYLYTHADAKTKKQMPIIVEGQTEKELMEAYRLLPQKDKETVLSLIQSLSKNATADRERIRRTLPQKDDDKK